jgi:hypothetical protein
VPAVLEMHPAEMHPPEVDAPEVDARAQEVDAPVPEVHAPEVDASPVEVHAGHGLVPEVNPEVDPADTAPYYRAVPEVYAAEVHAPVGDDPVT